MNEMGFRLYDLTSDYLELLELIEDNDDRYLDTLEALDGAIEDKVENYGKVIKSIEMVVEGHKAEEKRLAERRKYMENSIKRLKHNVEQSMIAMNKRKVKGDLFTFSIQKNPPRLEVLDDKLIPRDYFTDQAPKLENKLVLDAIKAGYEVPGAMLVQGESLRIK